MVAVVLVAVVVVVVVVVVGGSWSRSERLAEPPVLSGLRMSEVGARVGWKGEGRQWAGRGRHGIAGGEQGRQGRWSRLAHRRQAGRQAGKGKERQVCRGGGWPIRLRPDRAAVRGLRGHAAETCAFSVARGKNERKKKKKHKETHKNAKTQKHINT